MLNGNTDYPTVENRDEEFVVPLIFPFVMAINCSIFAANLK
jgi:hypothetical protein